MRWDSSAAPRAGHFLVPIVAHSRLSWSLPSLFHCYSCITQPSCLHPRSRFFFASFACVRLRRRVRQRRVATSRPLRSEDNNTSVGRTKRSFSESRIPRLYFNVKDGLLPSLSLSSSGSALYCPAELPVPFMARYRSVRDLSLSLRCVFCTGGRRCCVARSD